MVLFRMHNFKIIFFVSKTLYWSYSMSKEHVKLKVLKTYIGITVVILLKFRYSYIYLFFVSKLLCFNIL